MPILHQKNMVVAAIVECEIHVPGKEPIFTNVDFEQIAGKPVPVGTEDKMSIINYLREGYGKDSKIIINDVLYFQSQEDYDKYLASK